MRTLFLLPLALSCGGLKTSSDCQDGFERSDDGNCYPTSLDDTGTSEDGDEDADADADADEDEDLDGDGGPDLDGDADTDTDTDADADTDVTDGDCSASLDGSFDEVSINITDAAWGYAGGQAMMIGVEEGVACAAALPGEFFGDMLTIMIGPADPGLSGSMDISSDTSEEASDEMAARVEWMEAPPDGGEPSPVSLESGSLTLSGPADEDGGMFGSMDGTGSGGADRLSGDFRACWCQNIVDMLNEIGGSGPDGEGPSEEDGGPGEEDGGEAPA